MQGKMTICIMDSLRAFLQTTGKAVQGMLCSMDANREGPGHEIPSCVV